MRTVAPVDAFASLVFAVIEMPLTLAVTVAEPVTVPAVFDVNLTVHTPLAFVPVPS